jgi:cell division protease FtsH
MCSALGGRAAEEVIFNKISTGALSDLEKVTKQAYAMVSIYGLNKRVGNISYYDSQGRDMFTKPYSEDTAKIIDEEVSKMIEYQYTRAIQILTENKDKLEQLANKLLTAEVIFKEDLENIFGKRIWDKEEAIIDATEVSVDKSEDEGTKNIESNETIDSNENSSSESTNPDSDNPDSEIKE